jgi:hypothetical protein
MAKQFKTVSWFFLTQQEIVSKRVQTLRKRYAVIYSQRFMKLSSQQKIVPMFLHSWIYFEVTFWNYYVFIQNIYFWKLNFFGRENQCPHFLIIILFLGRNDSTFCS